MSPHAALVGLVVIGYDAQNTLDARKVLCLDGIDDGIRVVAAHAEQHGKPIGIGFEDGVDNEFLLVRAERRCFRCGSKSHQKVGAIVDDMVDDSYEGFCVNRLVLLERGDEGNARAFERIVFHAVVIVVFVFLPRPSSNCAGHGCLTLGRCLVGSR